MLEQLEIYGLSVAATFCLYAAAYCLESLYYRNR
jgi:hypothetical protein